MSAVHKFAETVEVGLCPSGTYALLIELEEPLRVKALLAPGLYVYCGSAKGRGGTAARIGRHMRRDKLAHWHVDQLTSVGTVLGAWIFLGRLRRRRSAGDARSGCLIRDGAAMLE